MKSLLPFFAILFYLSGTAQSLMGARSSGMGSLTAATEGINGLFANQAALASLESIAFIGVSEQKVLIKGLNISGVGVALPSKSGTFGLTFSNFGFSEFRQQKVGLSYARKLWQNISIGAQVDYFQTRIPEYGSNGTLTFELGLMAELAEGLLIGTHISNPYQIEIAPDDNFPTTVRVGLMYSVSNRASAGFEFEKDVDFPLRVKFGVEYLPIERLALRTGFSSNPANFHLGFGILVGGKFSIEMATRYNQELGMTPVAGFVYSLKSYDL